MSFFSIFLTSDKITLLLRNIDAVDNLIQKTFCAKIRSYSILKSIMQN